MKRHRVTLALAAAVLGGLALGVAPAVLAAPSSQVCSSASGSGGRCLNAWNGQNLVKTYAPGAQNNNFATVIIGHTTTNNPIPGVPAGLAIVTFQYLNLQTTCVSDNQNNPDDAKVGVFNGTCNGTGWGSRYVADSTGCALGFNKMINAHWSGNWSSRVGLGWAGDGNGIQMFQNTTPRCLIPR
jgi:hypothetical protein